MPLPTKQSSPALADNALRLPTEFPKLGSEVLQRFPSLAAWEKDVRGFFREYDNGMRDFAAATLDDTSLGNILFADPQNGSVYIRSVRGQGSYADPDTPFYVDQQGRFSLGSAFVWDPVEKSLVIEGTIHVDSGTIAGFTIDPTGLFAGSGDDYIALRSTGGIQVGEAPGNRAFMDSDNTSAGNTGFFLTISGGGTTGIFALDQAASDSAWLYIGGGASALTQAVTIRGLSSMIQFGVAEDTNLYRSAANTLKTDDNLIVGGNLTVNGTVIHDTDLTVTGDLTVGDDVFLSAGSVVTWAADTNLYRSSANNLATDDTFTAANFSGSSSGTNTGDQTNISGNAGTATALQNTRTIGGSNFNGTANVTSFPDPGTIGGGTPGDATFVDITINDDVTLATGSVLTWAGDTNLYRSGANILATDDALLVYGILQTESAFQVAGISSFNNYLQKVTPDGWTPILYDGDNSISFKWDGADLKVLIDATEFTITIT